MTRSIRVSGIKRGVVDDDKLALAFLLLAKTLHDRPVRGSERDATDVSTVRGDSEAA
jgi:hypothetical protein